MSRIGEVRVHELHVRWPTIHLVRLRRSLIKRSASERTGSTVFTWLRRLCSPPPSGLSPCAGRGASNKGLRPTVRALQQIDSTRPIADGGGAKCSLPGGRRRQERKPKTFGTRLRPTKSPAAERLEMHQDGTRDKAKATSRTSKSGTSTAQATKVRRDPQRVTRFNGRGGEFETATTASS